MKHNIIETIIGALVLLVATCIVIFAYRLNTVQGNNFVVYHASFDRIDGLVIGADVKVSGVKVGIVKGMEVDPETYLADVTLSVNDQIRLPKDTSAAVASESLMGGKYIALVPGGDEEFLKTGETITYTQSSVNLESLIGQVIFSNKSDKNTSAATSPSATPTP